MNFEKEFDRLTRSLLRLCSRLGGDPRSGVVEYCLPNFGFVRVSIPFKSVWNGHIIGSRRFIVVMPRGVRGRPEKWGLLADVIIGNGENCKNVWYYVGDSFWSRD